MRKISEMIYERSCQFIPGGVNSPVRSFRHLEMKPLVVKKGYQDTIVDADERTYIDYCMSWGSLILGHAHPQIVSKVTDAIKSGSSFGCLTEIESSLASLIVSLIPSVEKIRFVNSGTEATMSAMRLARGYTGKTKIVKFSGHYHGSSDSLLIQAGSGAFHLNAKATSKGVTEGTIADTICLPFNDFDALYTFFKSDAAKNLAGVILEPITGNMGVVLPEKGFLEALQEEIFKAKALLIFDEVITGFRVGLQGAQGLFKIQPDLTCFGKIIGGGFPVGAIGGKKEIMDYFSPLGEVYQAGTLSGNPIAMHAGFETLSIISQKGFYEALHEKVDRFVLPIREYLLKNNINACIQSQGAMFNLFFGLKKVTSLSDLIHLDEKRFIQFFKALFEKGIYISPSSKEAYFMSMAHTDRHIDYTVQTVIDLFSTWFEHHTSSW